MIISRIFALSICIAACATFGDSDANAADNSIRIKVEPVKIDHTQYPKGQIAPGQFPMVGSEINGGCRPEFTCSVQIHYEYSFGFGSITAKIDWVEIIPRLRISIWTQIGSPPRVLAHEETHRAIAEHYYAQAGRVARELASGLVGRKIEVSRKNYRDQVSGIIDSLEKSVTEDYRKAIPDVCQDAEERFDDVTDHGQNSISNADAMAQAIQPDAQRFGR